MARLVLDTNILINHFRLLKPYSTKRPSDAEEWAQQLIQDRKTGAIVSPVIVEFLCGVVNKHEMELAEAFLGPFVVIDIRGTLTRDWEEARRLAKHVGFHAEPRDLGDCLITAIADRLNYDVVTDDKGMLRQLGRTRRRRR